ncbi:putative mitochondrial carrier domain protein [Helianthus annuus]|nr:putative mitochondrial carrier domain protein [Helianthus annuus]
MSSADECKWSVGIWKHAASVVTADGKSVLEYTGMVDAFRKTVCYEGFGALYKGLVPNSVKVNIRVFFSFFFVFFFSKMPFSSLRFGQFCDFCPKVCFSASGSKRFEILPFSSD